MEMELKFSRFWTTSPRNYLKMFAGAIALLALYGYSPYMATAVSILNSEIKYN
jgi:hypothetical protein